MPDLTTEQLTLALAVVAALALLCILFVLLLAARLRKVRREYMSLRGEDGEERDILSAMGRTIKRVQTLDGRIAELSAAHKAHTALSRRSMQKFALVRYDAFEDMGGQLSFSAAVLDDHGDGLVITSINGRTETRTYAKPIKERQSEHNLSDEEREAIEAATSGVGRGEALPAPSRSR
ncbi:MAG: DUF4446 family protein [Actinomycetota bacterium]|nr:DUF4446 family protein [Actinomycetota bacterium]